MKFALVRIGTYIVIALALAGALRFTPELPEPDRRAADILTTQAAVPSWKLRFDTLGRGESLRALLLRGGLTDDAASRALEAASAVWRNMPSGMPVTLRSEAADSLPAEITLQIAMDRLLHLKRTGDKWTGSEERLPWTMDTIVVGGTISSTLYEAMDASAKNALPANARQQLAWSLADVLEYRVDMSRDLQVGDEFKVVAERSMAPTGATKIGKVIAATMKLSGNVIDVVYFSSPSVSGEYFDGSGKSARAAFLRAPLEFRRISSGFGFRLHPILGDIRKHQGTDYAAPMGTTVRAIGDGVVTQKGWANGYGNMLEIRHPNGFLTRYGHLSRFSNSVHVGSRVSIGQTVAFVGTTGLSTGPHLHFEVLVNGKQRDPRTALKVTGGEPLPDAERVVFTQIRDRLMSSLGGAANGVAKLGVH